MAEPYIGPRPFENDQKERFFGRESEANTLFALIYAHRVVLLYAQSGVGKTSLLNARLIPMLRDEKVQMLPVARLGGANIPGEIDLVKVNPFTVAALLNWLEADRIAPDQTLQDHLAQCWPAPTNTDYPIPRVLVFDQFEELFTAHAEHWARREEFIQQIVEALKADALLRVLLVLREDYVAQLDTLAPLFPRQLRARFYLERLRPDAARLAITEPLQAHGVEPRRRYDDGAVDMLLEELLRIKIASPEPDKKTIAVRGPYVEPLQLQVVCRSIWQSLPAEAEVITKAHIQAAGSVDLALQRFYDRTVATAARPPRISQRRLRRWCERTLITEMGTRNLVYRGAAQTGGMDNAVIDKLEAMHLIRAEQRGGARWYELTHDRFIEPIRRSNEPWRIGIWEALNRLKGPIVLILTLLIIAALFIYWQRQTLIPKGLLGACRVGMGPQDAFQTSYGEVVDLPYFEMDCYEVTEGQFTVFLHQGGLPDNEVLAYLRDAPYSLATQNLPMRNVTYDEAQTYCAAVGGALPTEAEWEFAVFGPGGLPSSESDEDKLPGCWYPWGSAFIMPDHANYDDPESDSPNQPALVGSHPPGRSRVGVYDLIGNVAEWVTLADDGSDYQGIRGGSYNSRASDPVRDCLSLRGEVGASVIAPQDVPESDYAKNQETRYEYYGFRCVYHP